MTRTGWEHTSLRWPSAMQMPHRLRCQKETLRQVASMARALPKYHNACDKLPTGANRQSDPVLLEHYSFAIHANNTYEVFLTRRQVC